MITTKFSKIKLTMSLLSYLIKLSAVPDSTHANSYYGIKHSSITIQININNKVSLNLFSVLFSKEQLLYILVFISSRLKFYSN